MIRGLYTAASAMVTQQIRQDAAANNLANVNTTGFKRDEVITHDFTTMLMKQLQLPREPIEGDIDLGLLGTGTAATQTITLHTQGTSIQTGNPLDLTIAGEGFFTIADPTNNTIRYTRNGHFLTDDQNRLITEDGWLVLGTGGPITLDGWDGSIAADGALNGTAYTLAIAHFADPTTMQKEGYNRYLAQDNPIAPPPDTRIQQGSLEGSNVSPISEMVNMITVMRTYETAQRIIQTQDQTLDKAVNEVGRV